jgi:RNA polymerase sigma-70 factor, ECF subfamily
VGDGAALLRALRGGHPGAAAVFYDRHAEHVCRTLTAALGTDEHLPDLLREVFRRALDGIGSLHDLERAGTWLTTIAIRVAREHLRARARRSWLRAFSPEPAHPHVPRPPMQPFDDGQRALREIYDVLEHLPVDERLAFVLRFVDGMSLPDAADACATSLATLQRRLVRAEKRFWAGVGQRPLLELWLERGARWHARKHS